MNRIKSMYIIDTKYGINMVAEMHDGTYYQQVHESLCHDGGGAATWRELKQDENGTPELLNPKTGNNG